MKKVELPSNIDWDQILKQLKNDDLVLTHQGRAVALLSEFDEDDLYWRERENDPDFIASIAESRAQAEAGNTMSHEELKRMLDQEGE